MTIAELRAIVAGRSTGERLAAAQELIALLDEELGYQRRRADLAEDAREQADLNLEILRQSTTPISIRPKRRSSR